jgi:flagellar basal body-associated protein FliL
VENQISIKITLELHEEWANNHSKEELIDYIRDRLNSSFGFRGEVKKVRLLKK